MSTVILPPNHPPITSMLEHDLPTAFVRGMPASSSYSSTRERRAHVTTHHPSHIGAQLAFRQSGHFCACGL